MDARGNTLHTWYHTAWKFERDIEHYVKRFKQDRTGSSASVVTLCRGRDGKIIPDIARPSFYQRKA